MGLLIAECFHTILADELTNFSKHEIQRAFIASLQENLLT